jgi:hypothetical protein
MSNSRKFSINEVKTLRGEENPSFECNVYANGEVICKASNTGTGGDNTYTWKNRLVEEEYQDEITDELIWDLISEKIPPRKIPKSVLEHRKQDEKELASWCLKIASALGEWSIGKGTGGTTRISHKDGWRFELFINSGMDYKDHTHRLTILMNSPIGDVPLTEEEEEEWEIPEFDLRTCTVGEIEKVLSSKINWLKLMMPKLQQRKEEKTKSIQRIQEAGKELAAALKVKIKERTCYENSFSIESENFSISIDPHVREDKSSFFLTADHISEDKLLKLLEICKQLEI